VQEARQIVRDLRGDDDKRPTKPAAAPAGTANDYDADAASRRR